MSNKRSYSNKNILLFISGIVWLIVWISLLAFTDIEDVAKWGLVLPVVYLGSILVMAGLIPPNVKKNKNIFRYIISIVLAATLLVLISLGLYFYLTILNELLA